MNTASIFDDLLDAVFVLAPDLSILYANDAAATLAGVSVKRIIGKILPDVLEFPNHFIENRVASLQPTDIKITYEELEILCKSLQQQVWVQALVKPTVYGGYNNANVLIIKDVSVEATLHRKYKQQLDNLGVLVNKLKKSEQQLIQMNKQQEVIIESRTFELNDANKMLKAMMNSVGQGFVVIDKKGVCGELFTKACLDIFEKDPSWLSLWSLLYPNHPEKKEQLWPWLQAVFHESLPFESLVALGPKSYDHSQGRHIDLSFFPIRGKMERIEYLVLVATDNTNAAKAQLMAQKERDFSRMVVAAVNNKEAFKTFILSLSGKIADLKNLTPKLVGADFDTLALRTWLHTFEGECAAFNLTTLVAATRHAQDALEDYMTSWKDALEESFLQLKSGIEEIVSSHHSLLVKYQELFQILGVFNKNSVEISKGDLDIFLEKIEQQAEHAELARLFKSMFLSKSVEQLLRHYNGLVQQMAKKQNKQLRDILFIGCDFKVLGTQWVALFESLVHAFKNSVDHSIELPHKRQLAGKRPAGQIIVSFNAGVRGGKEVFNLSIEDDGCGVDIDRLREKIGSGHEQLSDQEVLQWVFKLGLTTSSPNSEFSGRGVGMGAILLEVKKLGGSIELMTNLGKGSLLEIILPIKANVVEELDLVC